MSSKVIKFISDRRYRWMSNFYGAPIYLDDFGITFPTVEHAFQFCKTRDREWQDRIREAKSPGDAKRLGRRCPMRKDWEDVKVGVMTELVTKKFLQHPDLAKKLMDTGGRSIQEDSPWDAFWGTGKDGKGENMMGRILKKVRREL
jgi:ribA/ribD-fused uncharacterized protein